MVIQFSIFNLSCLEISSKACQAHQSFLHWHRAWNPSFNHVMQNDYVPKCASLLGYKHSTQYPITTVLPPHVFDTKNGVAQKDVYEHTSNRILSSNYPPACGKAGCVYQYISEVWRRGNTQDQNCYGHVTSCHTHGNIQVHTQFFWKIKLSTDGRTCLAEQGAHVGLMLIMSSTWMVFCPIFNSSKLCLGHASE